MDIYFGQCDNCYKFIQQNIFRYNTIYRHVMLKIHYLNASYVIQIILYDQI